MSKMCIGNIETKQLEKTDNIFVNCAEEFELSARGF